MAPTTRRRGASNQSSPLSTVPTHQGTPERRPTSLEHLSTNEGAHLTLEARIAAAERQRDELRALQRLRAIEEEIEHLQDLQQTPELTPDPVETSTRSQSAPQAHALAPVRRTLKPKSPNEYRGKNLKEHREFFRSCEIAFRLLPQEFAVDNDKVLWAMQYLGGDPRELWYAHYEHAFEALSLAPTWEYFKSYMLDMLADPINRSLDAATAHAQAMQRKDQTVRSFATYLEVIEEQLTPYTETQRIQHLFSKLRPELQRAVTNYHQIPPTREALIALCSTLERNLRRAQPAHEPRTHTMSTRTPRMAPKSQPRGPPPTYKDKRSVTCYKCNKQGHYANECRSTNPNPNQIPVGVQQTGKGQASQHRRDQ
jgi:hypothetical protein